MNIQSGIRIPTGQTVWSSVDNGANLRHKSGCLYEHLVPNSCGLPVDMDNTRQVHKTKSVHNRFLSIKVQGCCKHRGFILRIKQATEVRY